MLIKVAMGIEPEVYNEIREGEIKLQALRNMPASAMAESLEAMEAWEKSVQLQETITQALFARLVGEMVKNPKVNQPVQITLLINEAKEVGRACEKVMGYTNLTK